MFILTTKATYDEQKAWIKDNTALYFVGGDPQWDCLERLIYCFNIYPDYFSFGVYASHERLGLVLNFEEAKAKLVKNAKTKKVLGYNLPDRLSRQSTRHMKDDIRLGGDKIYLNWPERSCEIYVEESPCCSNVVLHLSGEKWEDLKGAKVAIDKSGKKYWVVDSTGLDKCRWTVHLIKMDQVMFDLSEGGDTSVVIVHLGDHVLREAKMGNVRIFFVKLTDVELAKISTRNIDEITHFDYEDKYYSVLNAISMGKGKDRKVFFILNAPETDLDLSCLNQTGGESCPEQSTDSDMLTFNCEKHGEFEAKALPGKNVYCPQCSEGGRVPNPGHGLRNWGCVRSFLLESGILMHDHDALLALEYLFEENARMEKELKHSAETVDRKIELESKLEKIKDIIS